MANRRIRSKFFGDAETERAVDQVEDWARANPEAARDLNRVWKANCKNAGHRTMGRAIYYLDTRPGILVEEPGEWTEAVPFRSPGGEEEG
jgi:hypothetical protein